MLIAKLEVRENRGSWAEGVPVEKKKEKQTTEQGLWMESCRQGQGSGGILFCIKKRRLQVLYLTFQVKSSNRGVTWSDLGVRSITLVIK